MRLIAGAQLAVHQREAPRLLGQLRRVRVGADLGDLARPAPATTKLPDEQLVAGLLHDGIGLAGQQRLVDLEVRAGQHRRVGDDLLTGAQVDDVVERRAR